MKESLVVASLAQERSRVEPLVEGLREAGLTVLWEADLPAGINERQTWAEWLAMARCVIVVWTEGSIGASGELIQDLAGQAKERRVLVPVRLDRVPEPLGFGQDRTLDLVGWNGKARHPRFRAVVAAARATIEGKPLPRLASEKGKVRWVAGLSALLAVGVPTLGFLADLQAVQRPICRLPGVHSLCGRWGFGGVPSPSEAQAWAALAPGDCDALRRHLGQFPEGAYAEEVARKLSAATSQNRETWTADVHRLPLVVSPTTEPFPTENAAQADAVARSEAAAEEVCGPYRSGFYRLNSWTAEVRRWNCYPRAGGVVCGFEGEAACQVEVRRTEVREVCP
jgi:TIR domain